MHHSVVKVLKNCRLEIFRIKFTIWCARQVQVSYVHVVATSVLLASNNILQKSSDMLNKNTLGLKRVRPISVCVLGLCKHVRVLGLWDNGKT